MIHPSTQYSDRIARLRDARHINIALLCVVLTQYAFGGAVRWF